MKQVMAVVVALAVVGMGWVPVQAAAEEGWTPLFDGKSLDGWTRRGGVAEYRIEGDAIVGSTIPGKEVEGKLQSGTPNTFLCTDQEYGDFILEFEFKVDPKMNSGVQIRSHSLPDYQNGRVHGYQVEIDPSARAWTAGIYDEARRGWLNNLENNPDAQKAFKQNEWNKIRVEAKGDSIKTWLNGVAAADLKDDMTPKGFIALQVHGTKEAQVMEVAWRNIRIKVLD